MSHPFARPWKWIPLFSGISCFLVAAPMPTVTTISSDSNPARLGLPLILRATVTPAPPSGRVTFYDRTTILGSAPLDKSGNATFTTIALLPGPHRLRAVYGGNAQFERSYSSYLAQSIWSSRSNNFIAGPENLLFGNYPNFVMAADFNGDGRMDVVAADYGGMYIFIRSDEGTFMPPVFYSLPNDGYNLHSLATADFRGTGSLDVVVASSEGVTFFWNNGDGTFFPAAAASIAADDVKVADFNRDGVPDIAYATHDGYGITIALGNGDGTFQKSREFLANESVYSLAVADFDRDGVPDIAFVLERGASPGSGLAVLYGEGGGGFHNLRYLYSPEDPDTVAKVATSDFNRDGKPDLVYVTPANFRVFLGKSAGAFGEGTVYPLLLGQATPSATTVDLNGDGYQDLGVFGPFINVSAILYGKGDGTFQPAVHPSFNAIAAVPADFNGDGRIDLAIIDPIYVDLGIKPAEDHTDYYLNTLLGAK